MGFEENIFGDFMYVWTAVELHGQSGEPGERPIPCLPCIHTSTLTRVLCTSLTFLTFYIQFVFGFYLVPAVAGDEIFEKVNITNQFKLYRTNHVGNMTDICDGEKWSWPESIADDLSKYVDHAHLLFIFPMCQGRLFAIVCMGVWACVIAMQFRAVFHSFVLVFMKNNTDDTDDEIGWCCEDPPDHDQVDDSNMNWNSLIGKSAVIKATFWRLLSVGYVGYYGMMFLAYTDNLKDFILNSVALAFIFEVPLYVHSAFMRLDTTRAIKDFNEEMGGKDEKFAIPKGLAKGFYFLLIFGTFAGLWHGLDSNKQFADMLTAKVFGKLCPSNETAGTLSGTPPHARH